MDFFLQWSPQVVKAHKVVYVNLKVLWNTVECSGILRPVIVVLSNNFEKEDITLQSYYFCEN